MQSLNEDFASMLFVLKEEKKPTRRRGLSPLALHPDLAFEEIP